MVRLKINEFINKTNRDMEQKEEDKKREEAEKRRQQQKEMLKE